jgi:kinesin family protein 6/9
VVLALSDKNRDHVPFRQSKLTSVLRDALGGNSRTVMITNVWGERKHIAETLVSLRFAARMMNVSTAPKKNIQYETAGLIKRYEKEIKDLKQELALHDTISKRGFVQYEAYSEFEIHELSKKIEAFLRGEVEDIEVRLLN